MKGLGLGTNLKNLTPNVFVRRYQWERPGT